MPRTRKTQSGKPAQPVQSVPGRRYGEGVASAELQRQMPTPQEVREVRPVTTAQNPQTGSAPGPAAPEAAAPPSAADAYAAQVAAAQSMAGKAGLLTRPSARPGEPVTAGLPIGPGVGPSALPPASSSPAQRFFEQIYAYSGDPYFMDLARRVRQAR